MIPLSFYWIEDSIGVLEIPHKFHGFPHGSGKNIFPSFVTYLKSKNADDNSKENLVKELAALDEHLQKSVSILTYFAS